MIDINEYKRIYQCALKTLKILNVLPYYYICTEKEYVFVNRAIKILTNFLSLKVIKQEDIKTINEIINITNPEIIFERYLFQIDKEFCENEFTKYLDDLNRYTIPNLEEYIDNGEFLKLYIEYKIELYNKQKSKEKQESGYTISKKI